jgi:hypothetical protein
VACWSEGESGRGVAARSAVQMTDDRCRRSGQDRQDRQDRRDRAGQGRAPEKMWSAQADDRTVTKRG